jgi:D-lactate dehydrogenase (cytochrome)
MRKLLRFFHSIKTSDVEHFKTILNGSILTENLEKYNHDWMGTFKGQSRLVLRPKTTEQVSKVLEYCNANKIAVVPQGGNTGLVGGSVPVKDEVILSTQLMNNIISFDETSGILTAEAGKSFGDSGCVLESLDSWLQERGFIMPLDLGAKGTCQIGGNVATNAGGLRLLRYGSLHGTVLSLEVVLADGTIMELGKPLRKDNTGYDLKHLFIGSEGTLGVITKVSILTPPKPKAVNVAVLGLESFEAVQTAFTLAKSELGEILSAYEFFDRSSLDLVRKHLEHSREPFETQSPFYVLIETQGSNKEHDDEKLEGFLEKLLKEDVISDGVLAQDTAQTKMFWEMREGITEACGKEGGLYKYDLSVPVNRLYSLVLDMRMRLRDMGLYHPDTNADGAVKHIIGFGHMGDGNLHLNIMTKGRSPELQSAIEPYIYELTQKNEGSISAEHGLGQMKAKYIGYSKQHEMIEYMKKVKAMFDPNGILNPYKYIQ